MGSALYDKVVSEKSKKVCNNVAIAVFRTYSYKEMKTKTMF